MTLRTLCSMAILATAGILSTMAQDFQKPDPDKWYRLVTRYNGNDGVRDNRCIQYFPEESEHPGLLWSADQIPSDLPEADYQYWRFEPSPDNPDLYAMICRADPEGYVSTMPTSLGVDGRWRYISTPARENPSDKYGFEFITTPTMSGVDEATGESYCALATDRTINSQFKFMNCGGAKQDYAINLWYETYSEEANEWSFRFVEHTEIATGITTPSMDNDGEDREKIYYDLLGRRVDNPGHGIYIVDGRKIVM